MADVGPRLRGLSIEVLSSEFVGWCVFGILLGLRAADFSGERVVEVVNRRTGV